MKALGILSMIFILLSIPSYAQSQHFQDYTSFSGLGAIGSGHGAVVGDFDDDGYEDVFIPGQTQPNMLLRNMGDSTFLNVISGSGISIQGYAYTACWADIDNDHDLDLFVGNFSNQFFSYSNQLYLNDGDGHFTDITFESGLGTLLATRSVLAADVDNDGFTDFYVCNSGGPNVLWRNNGDLSFTDVTVSSGTADLQISMGAIFFDYDNDGDQDLYVTHDANQANKLFQNDGMGLFSDVSFNSGLGLAAMGMGVDVADVNGDGWLDVYVTNLGPNFLFINDQDGTFTESGIASGTADLGMGWGCFFLDQDNDADRDLYVVNQYNFTPVTNKLYDNNGAASFSDIAAGNFLQSTNNGFGGTTFDMDNNGYQDIILANIGDTLLELYLNGTQLNNWISFELIGTISARDAFGARVTVYVGGEQFMGEKKSASSYSSQGSHKVHFGLGEMLLVDSVHIRFPSGVVNVAYDLPVNRAYSFIEDASMNVITCIPQADFSFESMNNGTYTFSADGDDDILLYTYQTSDGGSFLGPSGSYTFPAPGIYEVCLSVSNSCSFLELCDSIEVTCALPLASFTMETVGLEISLDSNLDMADSLHWEFGDGSGSVIQDPMHTYGSDGTYQICLNVFNECGMLSVCDSVDIICPLPNALFEYVPNALLVDFTALSADFDSVLWSFGDGEMSNGFSVQHVYTQEGNYQVCLTVSDICGTQTFCDSIIVNDLINGSFSEIRADEFLIYPNPAADLLFLETTLEKIDHFFLIANDGRTFSIAPEQTERGYLLPIADFPAGYYVLMTAGSYGVTYQDLLIYH